MEECLGFVAVHHLAHGGCRYVEVNAAGTSRDGGAEGAYHTCRYVFGTVHAVSGLHYRFGHVQLVKSFVCTLFKVDGFAYRRTGNLHHRVAIHRGVGRGGEAVHESQRGDRHQYAGEAVAVAVGGGRHAGLLLVAESYETDAFALYYVGCLRDGDSNQTVNVLDAHAFQALSQDPHTGDLLPVLGSGIRSASAAACAFIFRVIHSLLLHLAVG